MDMTVEVPELPELTFAEASHISRLSGDIIPSVSKLMEPLKDQCYGGISKRTLENAAIKGSAVHNLSLIHILAPFCATPEKTKEDKAS